MEKDTKILFGKLLGEIYRIQNHMQPSILPVKESTVYGLLNGFESVVDEEIERIGSVSSVELSNVMDILDVYFKDPQKLAEFKGYYDIEHELERVGIGRGQAIKILTYLYNNGQYTNIIEKMDSQYSPTECRRFELADYEK